MNEINKTLYIPLYGKSFVSQKGSILSDKKAEEIWSSVGFPLKKRSKSKWLAYYMGVRAAVFDEWAKEKMKEMRGAVVIHIGCGLDCRVERVGCCGHFWYDVDFPEVIAERRKYFAESGEYKMIEGNAENPEWLSLIDASESAIVLMEGVSMYLAPEKLKRLFAALSQKFGDVALLMDAYSVFAAKMSKYKNPVNDVGVSSVFGIDEPLLLSVDGLDFLSEREMTPKRFIDELSGAERFVFDKLYAGKTSKKLYKLYEYKKGDKKLKSE